MSQSPITATNENGIRVLLVYSSEVISKLIDSSLRVAPIGLFFINGYLHEKGYTTKIMNLIPGHFQESFPDADAYKAQLQQEIRAFAPHYIGYSFRNLFHWGEYPQDATKLINYMSMSLEKPTVAFLRQVTSAPIIGGGSAFTLAPKLYMNYLGLDYGIVGEGEVAFDDLLTKLEQQADLSDVSGLIYRQDNTLETRPIRLVPDLTTQPPMKISDLPDYRELYYENAGYGSVQTKRGCAFRCIYCQYPFLEGKAYRLRDMNTIMQEIADIKERYGIRHFFIVDSVFSTPVKQSVAFCDALIERKLDIQWNAYINPRGITKKVLEKYKASGCHNLILTPDALSAKVLKSYKKDFTIEQVKECIQLIKEVEIPFEVSIILGGPGEDEATVDEAVAFCDQYLEDVPVLFFHGMWLHPSAPAMETVKAEGLFHDLDAPDFDEIILTNDFESNHKLTYFFPHITTGRYAFLERIYKKLRQKKRIVVGKDSIFDRKTGIVKHHPDLGVIENARPWHTGMTGRQTCNDS